MHEGKLLQVGTPDELYRRPTHYHVAQFVGRSTLVDALPDGDQAQITIGKVSQYAPIASIGGDFSPQERTVAVIRPEMLALCGPETPDSWRGRVEMRRYAGGHFAYRVAAETGNTESNRGPNHKFEVTSEDGRFVDGSEVGLKLLPKPVALLRL
jgi:ABC-type Fe3+/spermidine/putrescine transport system ATPase subunit